MPVLENVQVSLKEVLDVRSEPLQEWEIWGVLFQTTQAVQDIFLRGHALQDGFPMYLVTPDNLLCTAMGRVVLNACQPDKIKKTTYWRDELKENADGCTQNNYLEKMYVFSIGQTMKYAAYLNQKLSPLLKTIFQAMCQTDVDLRMILSDIVQVCAFHAKKYMNGYTFVDVVALLHHEVLGSLPESEILAQVEKDILKENEKDKLNKNNTEELSDNDYCLKYLSYGERLGYHPEISLTVSPPQMQNNLTPKERWKKAYFGVREELQRTKLCSPEKDETLNSWKKHKAHQSIFRVYEELTERRKMLELLRLSINIGPTAPVDVDKNILTTGLKPKTIAELVLLLQRPSKQQSLNSKICGDAQDSNIDSSINSNIESPISNEENICKPYYYNIHDIALKQPFPENLNENHHFKGPEFVVNQMKPHKKLSPFGSNQELKRFAFTVVVNLLTGENLEIECILSTTGKQLYQSVADQLNLQERYLFGLAFNYGGEYIFVEKKQRVSELLHCYASKSTVISSDTIQLYFRVKFYLNDVHLMRTLRLRHLYYLQLRKDFLDSHFFCDNDLAISLSSFALQAELGNYDLTMHGEEYFLLEHYLPFSLIKQQNRSQWKTKLCNQHNLLNGVSRQLAELKFIQAYMNSPEYGCHFYKVYQDKRNISSAVWLGIRPTGIDVYENISGKKTLAQVYPWQNIKRISFSKKYFCIAPSNESLLGKCVVYRFYTTILSRSQYLFNLSMAHHKFYLKLMSVSKASEIFTDDIDEEHMYDCSKHGIDKEIGCDFYDTKNKFLPNNKMPRHKSSSHNDLKSLSESQVRRVMHFSPSSDLRQSKNTSPKLVARSSSDPNPERKTVLEHFYKVSSYKEIRPKATHTVPKSSCEKRIMKLVRLEKDIKCGYGLVITCGNTYDTVLHGAFIESVYPGGPADKDGNISPGDQIMFVNGTDVQNDHFLTVVDLLQYSACPVELVVAKSNKISSVSNIIKQEVTEEPFTKSKTWIVGGEKNVPLSDLERTESIIDKMPIPQPRKKWIDEEKPLNFDVPDLTLNHASNQCDNSWKKETNCNDIIGHHTRENIPDIIASQIKHELPVSSSMKHKEISDNELYFQLNQNVDYNFLLPGEVFHVVLDKKGGSLGLNIYQGTESIGSEQKHIFIHSVIENGAADLDGRIKPGDKLLEVNGVLLENLSYQEVVTKLRESPQVAHLVLEKGSLVETGQLETELLSKISSLNKHTKDNLNLQEDGTRHSGYSSQNRKELRANSIDANGLSEMYKSCDTEDMLTYSSLPTTNAECDSTYQSAKDTDFISCHQTKYQTQPSISPCLSPEQMNDDLESYDSFSSPINAMANNKMTPVSNLKSKLTSYSSTPNLAENSDEDDMRNETNNSLYRNKSTDCLTTPPFSNPHQGLFDAHRNFSFIRGSSSNLHPIPVVPIRKKKLKKLQDIYDYSNPDNTFKVSIRKSSRGLGLSICGGTGVSGRDTFSQLIRIRKLYPLQPALECGKLQMGDVILSVNDVNMVGLTNTEALEVLRTAPTDVVLEVFRPSKSLIPSYSTFKDGMWPFCDSSSSSASSSLSRTENIYNVETGEFEVTLIKRGGSLGFSISRKEADNSENGIYVKALVREPAISDGRIQPGDKILEVNGTIISTMSHTEAIEFIRNTPNSVTLKLFRADPPPTPGYSEKDNHISKPLRWEAVELLNDRLKHKESGDEKSFPKRKIKRKYDKTSKGPSNSSTESSSSASSSSQEHEHIIEEPTNCNNAEDIKVDAGLQRNQRPKSLDVLNSSDRKRCPTYVDKESFHRQSSVMCSNADSKAKNETDSSDSPAKKGKNLLKWRGSTLPHSEEDASPDVIPHANFSASSNSCNESQVSHESCSDEEKPVPFPRTTSRVSEWVHTFDVDLDRGWHGRLGFSLFDPPPTSPDSPRSLLPNAAEVKAVHPSSLADKDGRIKVGDRLVEANRECLLGKSAPEVIDILRKTRGVIKMVFCRLEKRM